MSILAPLCAGPPVHWGGRSLALPQAFQMWNCLMLHIAFRLAPAQSSQWSPLSSSITGVLLQETPSHGGKGALSSVITKLSYRRSLAHAGPQPPRLHLCVLSPWSLSHSFPDPLAFRERPPVPLPGLLGLPPTVPCILLSSSVRCHVAHGL